MDKFKKYNELIGLIHRTVTMISDETCRLSIRGLGDHNRLHHDMLMIFREILVDVCDMIITRQARMVGLSFN